LQQTSHKHVDETGEGSFNSMPSLLHRAARGITLWEFLRLKVRQDSDRPNSTPRLAQMIGEFDALQQQLRTVVKDQLVPVSTETDSSHPASKILVVSCQIFCLMKHDLYCLLCDDICSLSVSALMPLVG